MKVGLALFFALGLLVLLLGFLCDNRALSADERAGAYPLYFIGACIVAAALVVSFVVVVLEAFGVV